MAVDAAHSFAADLFCHGVSGGRAARAVALLGGAVGGGPGADFRPAGRQPLSPFRRSRPPGGGAAGTVAPPAALRHASLGLPWFEDSARRRAPGVARFFVGLG